MEQSVNQNGEIMRSDAVSLMSSMKGNNLAGIQVVNEENMVVVSSEQIQDA